MLKKLPVGIQTFSEIINKEYLYIDKTGIALDLIGSYKYVFYLVLEDLEKAFF